MGFRRRLLIIAFLIIAVIATGTAGYTILEGWGFLDSLYMTVITITTIGFEEVHDLSTAGRVFTIFLIFFSVGAVFYALNYGARILLEGELKDIFGRRRLYKTIGGLDKHYIVCGYGRMGKIVSQELARSGKPFVIVEQDPEIDPLKDSDYLVLRGDATRDSVLKDAGIDRAVGLITVLPTDALNLYVVLSARGIAPSLNIVARAVGEGSEKKLLRAGANKVVSPYHIGALRIARLLLKPTVADFIEFTTRTKGIDIRMEEIAVEDGADIAGSSLDQCGIGRELGVLIIAVKTTAGEMQVNPTHMYQIQPGDTLVAVGEVSKLKALEEKARR